MTFGIIIKGMDTSKNVMYYMIPIPYVILIILFIKGLTLPGKEVGWKYLFSADWTKLFTLQIWKDAAGQTIFSAGIGMNLIIYFSSHKGRREPILTPSFWAPTLNLLTSVFAATTLFAFVGHASMTSGVPIAEMSIKGFELAFVAYPAIIASMPFPQFWSLLFFIMLVVVGLSSEYSMVDGCSTILYGFIRNKT